MNTLVTDHNRTKTGALQFFCAFFGTHAVQHDSMQNA